MSDFGVTPEFKALTGIELDLADAERRLVLAQQEIDHLNKLADMHNAHINQIHRDLHESANLVGDIHQHGKLSADLKARVAAHVEKHGHPQDAPETEDLDQLRLTDG